MRFETNTEEEEDDIKQHNIEQDDDTLSFYSARSSAEWYSEDQGDEQTCPRPSSRASLRDCAGVPCVETCIIDVVPQNLGKSELDSQLRHIANPVEHEDHNLQALRRLWFDDVRPAFLPAIDYDPFLSPPNVDHMLMRFLRAEQNQGSSDAVASAAARLSETAQWRQEYRCLDFHRRGMARRLMMHKTNPGACMYFGDYGLRDREGEPVLVGRTSLMVDEKAPYRKPADKMIPAPHLRAAMFVIERAACETTRAGSYILDVGSYPAKDMESYGRYWDADGYIDCSHVIKERKPPSPTVGPHMPYHETMPDGLPVLKEAMRMSQSYYPDLLKRVYFYRPGVFFRAVFAVFSLWVSADTRKKFVMVKEGEEHLHFQASDMCLAGDLPPELGGHGPPLAGDQFMAQAVARYDKIATLPAD